MPRKPRPAAESTYTVQEFAAELKVNHVTVRRMIASGEIPSLRIGRCLRIPGYALDDVLSRAS